MNQQGISEWFSSAKPRLQEDLLGPTTLQERRGRVWWVQFFSWLSLMSGIWLVSKTIVQNKQRGHVIDQTHGPVLLHTVYELSV